jgi:heme exporter protein D
MNWAEFFAMGGKALYVWGSFGVTLVVMLGEVILVRSRGRTIRAQLGRNGNEILELE